MHAISALSLTNERDTLSDEATLVQAARADPALFEPLYQRYRHRVYSYLLARTSSAEDAADLTQQVFLQALDALSGYRGQGNGFAAWLFRIARNVATDYHRRQRSTTPWDDVPEAHHPLADDDPDAALLWHEALARLHVLLQALNPDTRELLALRFGARLTAPEIAAITGKGEAATKKRLARTIRALKDRYHDVR
jgi:RNA polymerase sigma-70 factor (ECF subfamily)